MEAGAHEKNQHKQVNYQYDYVSGMTLMKDKSRSKSTAPKTFSLGKKILMIYLKNKTGAYSYSSNSLHITHNKLVDRHFTLKQVFF